jgi:uncharacterized membrane protein
MNAPTLPLSAAYLLHMLATVAWIGGLAGVVLWVIPAGMRSLDSTAFSALLERSLQRLDLAAWLSVLVLVGTGMFQMSAHPAYEGFLSVQSTWAGAILVKHLFFFGMIGVNAYMTWGVLPQLKRLTLRRSGGGSYVEEQARLLRSHTRLLYLNLGMGGIVLALTALARVS